MLWRKAGMGYFLAMLLVGTVSGAAMAKETLTFWLGSTSQTAMELWRQAGQEFQNATGVEVEFAMWGWDVWNEKNQVAIAAGIGPDVLGNVLYRDILNGLLMPMTNYYNRWSEANAFIPAMVGKMNNDVYYTPVFAAFRVMHYNRTKFEEVGINPDTAPQSWEEFLQWVRKLTKVDGSRTTQTGFFPQANHVGNSLCDNFHMWVEQLNGALTSADYKKVTLVNENGRQVLQMMKSAYEYATPYPFVGGNLHQLVGTGQIAMSWSAYANRAEVFRMVPGAAIDFYLPRRAANAPPVSTGGLYGIGIGAGSKHPDLAWQFIQFFYNTQGAKGLYKMYGCAPTPRALQELVSAGVIGPKEMTAIQQLRPNPAFMGWETPMAQAFSKAIRGEVTIDAALAEAQQVGQNWLDDYWGKNKAAK